MGHLSSLSSLGSTFSCQCNCSGGRASFSLALPSTWRPNQCSVVLVTLLPAGTVGCPDRSWSSWPPSAEPQIRLLMARGDQSGISSSPKGLGV